jgi:hypothetical protein
MGIVKANGRRQDIHKRTALETTEARVLKHEKCGRRKLLDKNRTQWQYSVDASCLSQTQQKVMVILRSRLLMDI